MDFTAPTPEEKQILRDIGINPEDVVVRSHSEQALLVMHLLTRHNIMIFLK